MSSLLELAQTVAKDMAQLKEQCDAKSKAPQDIPQENVEVVAKYVTSWMTNAALLMQSALDDFKPNDGLFLRMLQDI